MHGTMGLKLRRDLWHTAGSGWFKGHEVSYCSVGKEKCSGAGIIIFAYLSKEI